VGRLRHLDEHGIEPVVAFLADGPFRAEVERAGVRTLRLADAPRLRRSWALPGRVRELVRAVRREDADVIEACGEKMAVLAGWAARAARVPCVYNLQDGPLRDAPAGLVQAAALAGRHDAVVVPSAWMAARFRRAGVRARVIPNALVLADLPVARPAEDGDAGRPLTVGHFGRLVAWKGADVLLRAAGALPDARFLLVGGALYDREPGYESRLTDLAEELGLTPRVRFAGHREDALALMAECDVVCHCAIEPEPFGMVVLEAMALGLPVVASRTGGPAELLDHGRTGVLVPPGDPAALGAELAALAGDPDRRRRLGEAARAEARERYGSEAIAPTLAELYRDVSGSPVR
jgi:glycosyltransferase involved in cell wall biosynthesis